MDSVSPEESINALPFIASQSDNVKYVNEDFVTFRTDYLAPSER